MMIWILATRGASTKLRATPFTETPIEGVHSVVYRPSVQVVALTGADEAEGSLGRFAPGLQRASGFVFSYHGLVAETLFSISTPIDLLVAYRANGASRTRRFADVLFAGDATVTFPGQGTTELIGVPFFVQISDGETLADHIIDTEDA